MARNIEELINRQIHRWNSMSELLGAGQPPAPAQARVTPVEVGGQRHPVICISREVGSGAREIARRLCQQLNYTIYGKEVINQIATDLKVQQRLINTLDENSRGELQLILESYLHGRATETTEYLGTLVRVFQTMARRGGVVLLGRGAGYVVHERAALTLLVTAPLERRIARIQAYTSQTAAEARAFVLAEDQRRDQFTRQYFKIAHNDPQQYDMVLNTGRMEPEAAVEVVLAALRARGFPPETIKLSGTPACND